MTRKVLTITLFATLLFAQGLSAFSYKTAAKNMVNSTSQATTDLSNYIKKHPIFWILTTGCLMGKDRINQGVYFAEEHPIITAILALTVIGTQTSTFE